MTGLITPAVAADLDQRGLLILDQQPQAPGEITAEQAKQRAQEWVRHFARFQQAWLERQHGGPIEVGRLAPCGRAFYASSSFEPLPPEVAAPMKRAWGSWWLVTLCGSSVPQVLLAVSATLGEWSQQPPLEGGSEYKWVGIPGGRTTSRLLAPEEAIVTAARAVGAPVASPPEFVVGVGGPLWAQWRVSVSRPVAVRLVRGERVVESAEFYVGPILDPLATGQAAVISAGVTTLGVASETQPPGISFGCVSTDELRTGRPPFKRTPCFAKLREGRALAVAPVVPR